jgi:hypothetical protein
MVHTLLSLVLLDHLCSVFWYTILEQAKGRLHRWDFETEEEWAKYNDQKEAMPKAAFQFGVKMQDGRKTRKQNKDQKLTNDLHKINKILARKKGEKDGAEDGGHYDDDLPSSKKQRGWSCHFSFLLLVMAFYGRVTMVFSWQLYHDAFI